MCGGVYESILIRKLRFKKEQEQIFGDFCVYGIEIRKVQLPKNNQESDVDFLVCFLLVVSLCERPPVVLIACY